MTSSPQQLAALVIPLEATSYAEIRGHMGLSLQRLFKHHLSQYGVEFGAHEAQAYTVSGLMQPLSNDGLAKPLLGKIKPGVCAWIRFTGLNNQMVAALNTFAAELPDALEVDKNQYWRVAGSAIWEPSEHPWAGYSSYENLWSLTDDPHYPARFSFEFATPTTFKSSENWLPLPHPMLFWGSLDRRWEALAPTQFKTPNSIPLFFEYLLPLSNFAGETALVQKKGRLHLLGFNGSASFTIRRDPEVEKTFQRLLDAPAETLLQLLPRYVHLLARFAFYGGVGAKTAMGMGMVRLH